MEDKLYKDIIETPRPRRRIGYIQHVHSPVWGQFGSYAKDICLVHTKKPSHFCEGCMAGAEGFEPSTKVLETHIAQKTRRFIFCLC